MAISPKFFPPRKRRPSAGSFISPNLSDLKLLGSVLFLSQEISALKPLEFILKRCSSSIIRKTKGLVILFEEIQRNQIVFLPRSAVLCFEEIYIVLQRIKTLLEDCSNGRSSKMWLLLQNESVCNSFHELTVELSTLLDIFPLREFGLSQDVMELVVLIRKQCWERKAASSHVDPADNNFRYEMLKLLDQIKKEIVPDHSYLKLMFHKLGLRDSTSCNEEMESLEEEILNQSSMVETIIALIGLVRYAKCVLFSADEDEDASTLSGHSRSLHPHPHHHHHHPQAEEATTAAAAAAVDIVCPVDFKCPISLDLMTDPVVVATGQTYDRNSISHWIESGHETCPKTGQHLSHSDLIPNRAMKNLISLWCREHKIPFDQTAVSSSSSSSSTLGMLMMRSTAAIEATRMTAFYLVNKLSVTQSTETANRIIYELRVLAKTDSDNRACIAEAGAIQLLVKYLDGGGGGGSNHHHPQLQVNAVTTLLNLSILEQNKKRIMESYEALDGVIQVLRSGATWESKENAAATIFSLSAVHEYRKKLWRKSRVIKGLVELGKEGPISAKRDALVAILNLAGDREAVGRLIEGGVVEMAVEAVQLLPEEAVAILATVAKRGGAVAVAAADQSVQRMAEVLRDGPEGARESATAGLVSICRRGGVEVVAELAATPGIERIIWELMGMGTVRARRKGASLLRILRRWAAGMEDQTTTTAATTTATVRLSSSTNNVHTTSRATLVHN